MRLVDTAGIRNTTDLIEKEGVLRTKEVTLNADIVFYIVDSSEGFLDEDRVFLESLKNIPVIIVWNKTDLAQSRPLPAGELLCKNQRGIVGTSFVNKSGISALSSALKDILFAGSSQEVRALGSERQKMAAQEALSCVSHALLVQKSDYALDAVVQDLEDALDALGELTGEVSPEDVLDSIFSHFCVGK